MKKTIKNLFIAILVIVPMVSTVQKVSATFPDVPADHIYADAINYVQEEGIVSGYSDGEFKAENTITRAEFTKIIINAKYNEEEINGCQTKYGYAYSSDINTKNIFPDVEALGKFSSYICMAKENGVVNGYGDGNCYPDRPITVGEASKIISNAYGLTDIQNPTNPDKFKPFVDALLQRNALPKYTTVISLFSPDDEPMSIINSLDEDLTRGSMAEIIYRLDNNITNKESLDYYEEFIEMKVEGIIYKGKSSNDPHLMSQLGTIQGYYLEKCVEDLVYSCNYYILDVDELSKQPLLKDENIGKEFNLNSGHYIFYAGIEEGAIYEFVGDNTFEPMWNN